VSDGAKDPTATAPPADSATSVVSTDSIGDWWADSPLSSATWVDLIDIAVLAVIIHRVIGAIRATRGLPVFLGLMLVFGVWVVSKVLGLSTMGWVLDHLAVYVALALLVLFQEDIRRFLAKAGGAVFRDNDVGANVNRMEEVIRAAFALAHRKIGALIVIERNVSLESYAENAHHLDAEVTAELLQSLFHPLSPLHDGAVVISNQRLAWAGVFVPIALSKDISKAYGTRHRAAIGLTEAIDAICIVVSEERGTVALVKDGKVVPVADANDLRQVLTEKLEEAIDAGAPARAGSGGGRG
jgi:diadenylate cyclase